MNADQNKDGSNARRPERIPPFQGVEDAVGAERGKIPPEDCPLFPGTGTRSSVLCEEAAPELGIEPPRPVHEGGDVLEMFRIGL